jgi:hypothetical protein
MLMYHADLDNAESMDSRKRSRGYRIGRMIPGNKRKGETGKGKENEQRKKENCIALKGHYTKKGLHIQEEKEIIMCRSTLRNMKLKQSVCAGENNFSACFDWLGSPD